MIKRPFNHILLGRRALPFFRYCCSDLYVCTCNCYSYILILSMTHLNFTKYWTETHADSIDWSWEFPISRLHFLSYLIKFNSHKFHRLQQKILKFISISDFYSHKDDFGKNLDGFAKTEMNQSEMREWPGETPSSRFQLAHCWHMLFFTCLDIVKI